METTPTYCHECAPQFGATVKRTDVDDARLRCAGCGKSNYSVKMVQP